MEGKVKISVIIPLYNKEKYIEKAIKSVLKQNFKDFELIIVDDGSTDKSADISKKFKDSRIKVLEKPNGGVSSARNYGAKYAKGEFLFFLDADDEITSSCLNVLYDLHIDYPDAEIVTANHINVRDGKAKIFCLRQKRGIVRYPMKDFFHGDISPRTGASLYNKNVFFEIGGFDERISIYEDLDLDIRFINFCKYAYTPDIVYKHILDNSELSIKPKPIEKYFSYYIDLGRRSFWEKMKLVNCIMATYYKFQTFQNKDACLLLKDKLKEHHALFVFFRFYQKYCQYRRQHLSKDFRLADFENL